MTDIEKIRAEIERRIDILATVSVKQAKDGDSEMSTYYHGKAVSLEELISFLDTLEEEPEEESDLQDAEVIFSGYALHTDVTKWADGYKLKIRIYDDN